MPAGKQISLVVGLDESHGCWIVVGVDGLWSHEPFRLVGLFVDALFNVVAAHKLGGLGEVLIV